MFTLYIYADNEENVNNHIPKIVIIIIIVPFIRSYIQQVTDVYTVYNRSIIIHSYLELDKYRVNKISIRSNLIFHLQCIYIEMWRNLDSMWRS